MIDQAREQHEPFSLRQLCRLFAINRAWYYQRKQRVRQGKSTRHRQEDEWLHAATEVRAQYRFYGYRRIARALSLMGLPVSPKQSWRLVHRAGLQVRRPRRWIRTTRTVEGQPIFENLTQEREVTAPNQCWVADLTYVRLPHRWVYLACILDAYSRVCVGWNLSERADALLTQGALEMALACRQVPVGLIHHSDRGVQYTSGSYLQRLAQVGARPSMSRRGNPYDNATAESFFKTVKYEEVYLHSYQSLEQAQSHLAHFLEDVYNAKRFHSSLGYLSPLQFEAQCFTCSSP